MSMLDDTLEPMTSEEMKASIYEIISITGVDVTAWKPGAVARTMITAAAIVLAALTVLASLVGKATWLTYSRGFWLTLLAKHWYGVEREPASFGRCAYQITNTGGGVYDWDAFELTLSNPDTKKTYRNVSAVHIGGGATVTFTIESRESGAASTSTLGTIVVVDGFDELQGTNLSTLVCTDEETDPNLIARCEATRGARSPKGTRDAYEIAARGAKRSDGLPVQINRVRTAKDGKGNVFVWLAGPDGAINGTVGDLGTDLGAAADACQRLAAPLGVTAIVSSCTETVLAFNYTAWVKDTSGLLASEVTQLVNQELALFLNGLPIGGVKLDEEPGKVFLDTARASMTKAIPPEAVWHIAISLPVADPELGASAVATLGAVTATINFTNQNVVNAN